MFVQYQIKAHKVYRTVSKTWYARNKHTFYTIPNTSKTSSVKHRQATCICTELLNRYSGQIFFLKLIYGNFFLI